MPAALDVDKEAVKMLVMQYGVRETARQLGLPEPTVQAWSARGRWLIDAPRSQSLPATMIRPATVATVSPSQALAAQMRDDAMKGRAAALRAGRTALERVATYDADELVTPEVADVALKWTKQHATAAGYGANDAVARVDLRIVGDRSKAETIEADWSEVAEVAEGQGFVE